MPVPPLLQSPRIGSGPRGTISACNGEIMRQIILGLLALGVAGWMVAGCKKEAGSNSNATEVVIGEYASLTGATASFGQSSHEGSLIAIDEVNAAGGVLGKKIVLKTEDDRSNANEAVTAVQKLINRDKVVAILGEVASKRSPGRGKRVPARKDPDAFAGQHQPGGDAGRGLHLPHLLHRRLSGHGVRASSPERGLEGVAILTDVANDYSKGLTKAFKEAYPKTGGSDRRGRELPRGRQRLQGAALEDQGSQRRRGVPARLLHGRRHDPPPGAARSG